MAMSKPDLIEDIEWMTARDFCFWLQGYLDLTEVQALNPEQVRKIAAHVALALRNDSPPTTGKT